MTQHIDALAYDMYRWLAEAADKEGHDDDHHMDDDGHGGGHAFGVHIEYVDLYNAVLFLTCIYVSGQIASRVLQMPNLVGEIFCGILLGPPLADFVPNPEAWVMLGEIGLVLLVIEAGIDIDLSTLKLIGTRGFLIAFFGSILPIGLGMLIAWILNITDTKGIIAAGAAFGPTSLGIALNILRSGGILNTPVGQLIVSAAVIDDMIALVVLSQLEALTGEVTIVGVVIPIIAALGFLVVGGYVAIFIVPPIINGYILPKFNEDVHHRVEMVIMIILLLVLKPATYYCQASYLMGAFIAGLAFCTSHSLHHAFVVQFKRLLQWLMRIFFAASIGFQVPIKDFGNITVIWQGLVFTLALLGKLGVGFMVPNFTQSGMFTNFHLRDCLITGFSMAAEGEFAFVIAVFGVSNALISEDLYASIVLAVLLSTIIPPFLLRFTISYYNKKAEEMLEKVAHDEMGRRHDLESIHEGPTDTEKREEELASAIAHKSIVFLCIQTQSESSWGLLHNIMSCLSKHHMDIIDHRAWQPRGINSTLVNEIYCKSQIEVKVKGSSQEALNKHMEEIKEALLKVIDQPDVAKVKVQRWFPGVVEDIVEEVNEKAQSSINISQRLLAEAAQELERKQMLQTTATQAKTVDTIFAEMKSETKEDFTPKMADLEAGRPRGRRRQKMRSTPVVGGGLFGETSSSATNDFSKEFKKTPGKKQKVNPNAWNLGGSNGIAAEMIVDGESYNIRITQETLKNLQKGFRGQMVDSRGIEMSGLSITASEDTPVVNRLQGYVRNMGALNRIKEETIEEGSEVSSNHKE